MVKFNFIFRYGVILVLLVGSFLIIERYSDNTEPFIKQINIECKGALLKERQECLESKIITYVDKNPNRTKELFDSIWKSLETGGLPDDARIFSPIAHDVGMLLSAKGISVEDSLGVCGLSFRGGCIHGIFMEDTDDKNERIEPENLIKECVSLRDKIIINSDSFFANCIHGVGHELVANMKGGLNDTLMLCNKVPDNFRNDCVYGVFMEYSKGEAGMGHHSEKPVGRKDFDCVSVDDSFKKICYISSGFYRQYEVDSEPLEKTYLFCSATPSRYKQDCFDGVNGAVLFSNAFVTKRFYYSCMSLSNDFQNLCLDSLKF